MRLFLALILLPLSVWATNSISENSPLEPAPPSNSKPVASPLDGRWQLVDRNCSSGALPSDRFIVGRDYADYTFDGDLARSYVRITNCELMVDGRFELFENLLSIYPRFYRASCGPVNLPMREDYSVSFDPKGNTMSLIAPMRGFGGTCPASDSIQLVFERY